MRIPTIVILLGLLAGCQSYERAPLDTEAHRKEWIARNPGDNAVAAYAARLSSRCETPRAPFLPADGLNLAEAEVVALFFHPDLRAARLEAGVELAAAEEAGRWEDPELEIDAAAILASIPQPWLLASSLSFTIPLSGRPGVERDLAMASCDVTRRLVVEREWEVLSGLRAAWIEAVSVNETLALVRTQASDLKSAQELAVRLRDAGELSRAEARLFDLELALLRDEELDLAAQAEVARLAVLELLGLHPESGVKLDLRLPAAVVAASAAQAEAKLLERNPAIDVRRVEYEVAEQSLRLEIRKQYPDLSIGPSYEIEEGQSKIGLGFGLPLPILNRNLEGIARARAERKAAGSRFEAEVERKLHALARAETALARARARQERLQKEVAPLADEQVADMHELAALGEFDALLALEALKTRHEVRLAVLEATIAERVAESDLIALLGPDFRPEPSTENNDE